MRVIKDTIKLIRKMKLYDKINGGTVPFEPWPRQIEWLDHLHEYLLLIMLKKRQVAGSTLTGCDSICQCGLLPNFLTLVLSKTGDDSEEHLRRVLDCYESFPDEIKLGMPIKGKPTVDKIEFVNGSRFLSLPANKGAGFTPDRVLVDEAPKITIKNSKITLETVLNNVYPGLEKSQGQLILLGTAEGFGSFQQRYDMAKRGHGGWKSFFFSCWDDPSFTKDQRAQMVQDFGEDLTNQEYPRTDTEAFLMSGRCRFNRASLTEIADVQVQPGTRGYFERVGRNRIRFVKHDGGWVTMFKDAEKRMRYIAGGDPCQGLEISKVDRKNTDEGAFQILRATNCEQVCEIRNRHEPDVFAEDCLMAAQYYNNAFAGIERNKERSVVLYFVKNNYWNLYYEEPYDDERQTRARNVGWFTTASNKRILIANGDKAIREKSCIIRSAELLAQLRTFIRLVDGSCEAQEGCKDDLVMSWLIALEMANFTEFNLDEDDDPHAPKKFDDTWTNADGSIDAESAGGDELLDAAMNGKLNGMNYFNR